LVAGTARSDFWSAKDGVNFGRSSGSPTLAHVIRVPEEPSADEVSRFQKIARHDRQFDLILGAVAKQRSMFRKVLEHSAPSIKASSDDDLSYVLVSALADLRRIGFMAPVPDMLLRKSAAAYVDSRRGELQSGWFERALGQLQDRNLGTAAVWQTEAGYVLADYLVFKMNVARRYLPIPLGVWKAVQTNDMESEDLLRIGRSAEKRCLPEIAITLYQRSASSGNDLSVFRLANLLDECGHQEDALRLYRRLAASSDHNLRFQIAETLSSRGYINEAALLVLDVKSKSDRAALMSRFTVLAARRHLATSDWPIAHREDSRFFHSWNEASFASGRHVKELLQGLPKSRGDEVAHVAWLQSSGRDEDESSLNKEIRAGSVEAALLLAGLLVRRGDTANAIGMLRELIASDMLSAGQRYVVGGILSASAGESELGG
jgi:hypothetical protein